MAPEWISEAEAERKAREAYNRGMDEGIGRMDEESQWHLDKRVPITLIAAFVIQTITLVYVGTTWKSDVDHRLDSLEKSDEARRPQENRIIVVEQQLKFIADSVGRIEMKLDNRSGPETK